MQMRHFTPILLLSVLTGVVYGQTTDKELFQDAESRFASRDYELALDRYDVLIREYPLSQYIPDVQFRRAVCLYRVGRYEESLSLFTRIESRYRSTRYLPFVSFWIGVVEYHRTEYQSAVVAFTRFLSLGVESDLVKQALLYKGLAEAALGLNADAKVTLATLISQVENPGEQPSAMVLLMSLYVKDGEYAEVIDLYRSIKLESFDARERDRIVLYAAEALYYHGDHDQSRSLYERITSSEPEIMTVVYQRLFMIAQDAGDGEESRRLVTRAEKELAGRPGILKEFWLRVGTQSFDQGKFDLAEYYFQRVWDLRKMENISASAPLYLAELKMRQKEPLKAVQFLEEFLALGVDRLDLVLLKLGELYVETGEWKKAEDHLTRFLLEFPASPSFAQGAYLRAYALYRDGKHGESLEIIRTLFAQGKAGPYSGQLLKLRATVLQKQGAREDAVQTLREYLSVARNDDIEVKIDLLKLLFLEQKYEKVIEESLQLYKQYPRLDRDYASDYLLSTYLLGLSYISQKKYQDAQDALKNVTAQALDKVELGTMIPYSLFYRGWARYKLGRYDEATTEFDALISSFPTHELAPRSAYLAGWSAFTTGKYEAAEPYLSRLAGMDAPADLKQKAVFLLGKSQFARKMYQDAAITFQNIFLKTPDSEFADDALYEHSGVLLLMGQVDDSVAGYYRMFEKYPESPLRQESLYKRGEILFNTDRYKEARDAFYEFRSFFPGSRQFDAALYWGGFASEKLGELFGAVILWERIIGEYRDSPFRPDAMQRTAEIYAQTGEFRKALNLYSELMAVYPKEAKSVSADRRAEELRYLILGLSDKEAELSVTIGREGGARTEAGRKAILELSRIYIFEGGSKQDLAVSMLSDVVQRRTEDPGSAALARYLLGEYYYRKNDLLQAANVFLEAATMNPQDRDLMAMSIFRSAEMMKLAGKTQDAVNLVQRLETNFPSSQWAVEGRRLLGDKR